MKNLDKTIWIEAEQWSDGQWDIEDVNTDVRVTFSNHMQWVATFYTYRNIQTLRAKNEKSGECMNGAYFRASDMIVIDIGSKKRIYEVIDDLLENDEFEQAFSRCSDE